MDVRIAKHGWTQIGGNRDPGTFGGTIAKADGRSIEILKIQPVREYVGDAEAAEVGFPFWTKEAYFDRDDLDLSNEHVQSALEYVGLDRDALEALRPESRAMVIAEALLDYGMDEEGPSGWAKDVVPDRVQWWGSKRPSGWRFIADSDVEFRRMLRER